MEQFIRNIEKLISKSDEMSKIHNKYEIEINKRIETMKTKYGIADVLWQAGWTLNHCKGCLQLFSRVVDSFNVPRNSLNGWVSYVSVYTLIDS